MNFYIVIPAHNEEKHIAETLTSIVNQTLLPKKLIVVNDNSTDTTEIIIDEFTRKYPFIQKVNNVSNHTHLPGSKVIQSFNAGLKVLDENYDVICKFDADLIFPENYLEKLAFHFSKNLKAGMVGGFCYIKKNNVWILENLTGKDHIRGGIKAYTKACFTSIGGLKTSMGWDTVDELLAKYHNWLVITDETLHVKHLKPTGYVYNNRAKHKQGEAFYKLRYGFILTLIASLKLAVRKKKVYYFFNCIAGYLKARKNKLPFLVTPEEGKFIRHFRWQGIFKKLF